MVSLKHLKFLLRSYYYSLIPFDLKLRIESFRLLKYRKSLLARELKPFISHKCIFVHIPKNAGTSIAKGLFNTLVQHLTIEEYKRILDISNFFAFSFVRNPYSRLASTFSYFKHGGEGISEEDRILAELHINKFANLEEFVKKWLTPYNIMKITHFWPQHKFITINNKISIDYIGKVEDIEKDFSCICNKLGIRRTLPHLNKTYIKDASYTEEAKKIVRSVYHKDFELFNYK